LAKCTIENFQPIEKRKDHFKHDRFGLICLAVVVKLFLSIYYCCNINLFLLFKPDWTEFSNKCQIIDFPLIFIFILLLVSHSS